MLIAELSAEPASIAPKFFYDPLGSRLFELITVLPEYYLTRTEGELMEKHVGAIAETVGTGGSLIDLGAGNCEKARKLLPHLRPRQYVAVDISIGFLDQALTRLRSAFPDVEMLSVGSDLTTDLALPGSVALERRTFFYPGSSIGNFDPADALKLLVRIRDLCSDSGGLLIGVDLVKDNAILDAAYNDALGLTGAFNLNVLNHVNALIGSDFKPRHWKHVAFYNDARSRIEMHLEALRETRVSWPGGERHFAAGERIHTENSYKYTVEGFQTLLAQAGFGNLRCWTDDKHWFAVFHARRP